MFVRSVEEQNILTKIVFMLIIVVLSNNTNISFLSLVPNVACVSGLSILDCFFCFL